jgi:hypothetical protein
MHNQEYYAFKADGTGFVKIERAKPVENEYGMDLFIHHSLSPTRYKWTVTEGETGCVVGNGDTRKEAIQHTLDNIQRRGMENVLSVISGHLMRYGHTPRYPEAA